MFTTEIIIAMSLCFVGGMVFAMIVGNIRKMRKQHKIDQIYLPQYDVNNPINGGQPLPEDTIVTEEGIVLYRIHPQGV